MPMVERSCSLTISLVANTSIDDMRMAPRCKPGAKPWGPKLSSAWLPVRTAGTSSTEIPKTHVLVVFHPRGVGGHAMNEQDKEGQLVIWSSFAGHEPMMVIGYQSSALPRRVNRGSASAASSASEGEGCGIIFCKHIADTYVQSPK